MVDVPAATLARLAPLLAGQERRARRNGSRLPADLAALLAAAQAAEQHLAATAVPPLAPDGSNPAPSDAGDDGASILSAVEVARLAGCSRRAVVKAASTGRLAGRLTPEGWRFTPKAAADWTNRRTNRMAAAKAAQTDRAAAAFLAERRAELADVEQQLAALDDRQSTLDHQRDAAQALLEAARARGGDPVTEWRAAESLAEAQDALRALIAERRPLAERRIRLAEVVAPAVRAERQAAREEAAEKAKGVLREALADLDTALGKVETARQIASNGCAGWFSVPASLTNLTRQFAPGSGTRVGLEMALKPRNGGTR